MDNRGYIPIPLAIAIFVQLFVPYFKSLHVKDIFLSPSYLFHTAVFVSKYILLGFLLYESRRINNDDIFIFTWIAVAINLIWSYYINRNNKYAVIFLFASLLAGYLIYNEIFLSRLTDNEDALYLNLMSAYLVWIGYMITLVFQYEQNYRVKNLVKNKVIKPG